jgi:hypothetical protein
MMPRRIGPEPGWMLDVDRGGSAALAGKQAALATEDDMADRAADRAGARDLDQAVEAMPGMSRAARDRERAMPRSGGGGIPDPRMERTLPSPGQTRAPLSSRQRKARSAIKRATQDTLPQTQYAALRALASDPEYRARVNDALSAATGDAQQLDEGVRRQVQRADAAIRAYEKANDRGHVVYVNVQLPGALQGGDPVGVARSFLPPGAVLEFDRFTGAAHTMHEVDPGSGGEGTLLLEVQTRRGIYLGRSDSVDDTTHLLPRGMRVRVAGDAHYAAYRRPDGTTGRRPTVQVLDMPES